MQRSWFKLNKWKTGWVPIAWQGWLITLSYLTFTVYNFFRIDRVSPSASDTLMSFIPQTLLFTGLLSIVCYFTSEKTQM